jgi:hypothetical protein
VVLNVWQFVLAEFTLKKTKVSKVSLKAFVTKYQNSATKKNPGSKVFTQNPG